jgi:hypothetical protein
VIDEPGDKIENLFLAFGKLHDFTFSPLQILGGEMVKVNKKVVSDQSPVTSGIPLTTDD